MIVAVAAVGMMQVTVDEIVQVVSVGDRLMTASGAVLVGPVVRAAGVRGRAARGVRAAHGDRALVHVVAVGAVKVAVMKVIGVPVV